MGHLRDLDERDHEYSMRGVYDWFLYYENNIMIEFVEQAFSA